MIKVAVWFVTVVVAIEILRVPLVVVLPGKVRLGRGGGLQCVDHQFARALVVAPASVRILYWSTVVVQRLGQLYDRKDIAGDIVDTARLVPVVVGEGARLRGHWASGKQEVLEVRAVLVVLGGVAGEAVVACAVKTYR